ncbi:MAG: TetR/AcrR family transcriptional regulator [Saprospiraceae bacterium]
MSEKDTENIIKEAARKIFQKNGFDGTKTRQIAEAADINLALLNYYFRSKKKLYDIIMLETIQSFFSGLIPILSNRQTNLKQKISLLVERYIDILSANPDMANFIINELRQNPKDFATKIGILEIVKNSVFAHQYVQGVSGGHIPKIHPIHYLMNLTSLTVFPFVSSPMISIITGASDEMLGEIMQERKRLIPLWVESMLSVQ